MVAFAVRRVVLICAVVVVVTFGVFAAWQYDVRDVDYCYGDCPFDYNTKMRSIRGLDRPILVQFADYVCGGLCVQDARNDGIVRGGFGQSVRRNTDIADIIKAGLPISAQLGLAALVVLYAVGTTLGGLAAAKRDTWVDRCIALGCTAVKSVPVFVLTLMLLIVIVFRLGIAGVAYGWEGLSWEGLFSVGAILPVVLVALAAMPGVVRMTRAGVIDALGHDCVRTARAKGLPEWMVIRRHVVRNAMTPLASGLMPTMATLLFSVLLVERILMIPGFGDALVRSLEERDWPTILALVVLGLAAWAVCSLAADLLHWALDPRIRYDSPVSRSRTAGRALAV